MSVMSTDTIVHVRLDVETANALKAMATARDRPVSYIAREYIKAALKVAAA